MSFKPTVSPQTRLNFAMLLGGLGSFSLIYAPQPLLPMLSEAFGISAAAASLAVSLTTGPLAIAILAAGVLGDRMPRPLLMQISLLAGAALTVAAAFSPSWHLLLVLRVLTGLALAGVPAVAMAHIAEEAGADALGPAMGLYVAGTAIGGMSGRLGVSLFADLLDWRWAIGLMGLAGVAATVAFALILPSASRPRPEREPLHFVGVLIGFARLLADRQLLILYLGAFLFMGAFVTIYNYAGFHLLAPPFSLTPAQIGLIFVLYLTGSISSAIFGWLSTRFGRPRVYPIALAILVLGVIATLATNTPSFVLGVGLVTFGFFGAHSIASGWVGARASVLGGKGAALYLFFYYAGAAVLSSLGGLAWGSGGWKGVVAYAVAVSLLALAGGLVLLTGSRGVANQTPKSPPIEG